MEAIEISTVAGPVSGRVRPPGSKSLTNRALVAAALAGGKSRLNGVLRSEDTQVMIDSLIRLGVAVQSDPATRALDVFGCGGRIPASKAQMYIANSGTTVRFLTALVATGPRRVSSRRAAANAATTHSRFARRAGETRSRCPQ